LYGDIQVGVVMAFAQAKTLQQNPLTSLLSDKRIATASVGHSSRLKTNPQEVNLCFGIRKLDDLFAGSLSPSQASTTSQVSGPLSGGIPLGSLLEMGIPFGNGGRRLLVQFIAAATSGISGAQKHWCLWISARTQPEVYPPAWQAMGVDLSLLRFASSESPVADLKAAFLDDLFRLIVIDHPKGLRSDEYTFLAQCARQHRKIIVVAHDRVLSPKDSNTAARYRLNVSKSPEKNVLQLTPVRGLHQNLELPSFFQHPHLKIIP
jgi:hypothetical protein